MLRQLFALLAALMLITPTQLMAQTQTCGADTDCPVDGGDYRISLPEGRQGDAPIGAIVFAHGYRGSSAGVMRNRGFRRMASELGIALIALNAAGDDWDLPNAPGHDTSIRDEMTYVDRVLNDATERFGLDPERVVAAGFSAGGMFVWNLICERSDRFMGFVPMSGTFWKEAPESCRAPPANVIHIHGDADRTVPLEGRAIGDTTQGNVFDVLGMYRTYGGYGEARDVEAAGMTCSARRNPAGKRLDFCLFSGGHSFSLVRLRQAWKWLDE